MQEPDRGGGLLVRQRFGVGEAGVAVDGRMEIQVRGLRLMSPSGRKSPAVQPEAADDPADCVAADPNAVIVELERDPRGEPSALAALDLDQFDDLR